MKSTEINSRSVEVATMVIIHAGNSRKFVNEAIVFAKDFNFEMAKEKLEQAKKEITSAHKTQTEVIQAEARGKPIEITLLLTHAQDTLMTAMSEVHTAKHMIDLLQLIHDLKTE